MKIDVKIIGAGLEASTGFILLRRFGDAWVGERERNAVQREIYTCVFESVGGAVPLASVIWKDFLKIPNHTSRRTGDPVENGDQNG